MKKLVFLTVAGLVAASVAAYAQMHHQGPGSPSEGPRHRHGEMGPGMMRMQHGAMPGGAMHGRMHGGMHGGMRHGDVSESHASAVAPKGDSGPSSLAFHGINAKMHTAMDITFTGNADADFVKGMIPHHEGAVDMAKTVMAFGKDPEIRKLAEEIVRAQESEIALMKAWLAKNPRQ
jgi:hypothetical protein